MKIYLAGVVATLILLIVMTIYEKKVNNETVDDLPTALLSSVCSWATFVFIFIAYRNDIKYILHNGFKEKEQR